MEKVLLSLRSCEFYRILVENMWYVHLVRFTNAYIYPKEIQTQATINGGYPFLPSPLGLWVTPAGLHSVFDQINWSVQPFTVLNTAANNDKWEPSLSSLVSPQTWPAPGHSRDWIWAKSCNLLFYFCLGSCLDNKIHSLWQTHGGCNISVYVCSWQLWVFFHVHLVLILFLFLTGYGWSGSHGGR